MIGELRVVKIPQILGAALAANIFVLLAFQTASLPTISSTAIVSMVAILLWNLKDFFDDMKAYEVENIEGFSLFPTVFFRVLSYMALAAGIASLGSGFDAFYALAGYFFVFTVWSLVSLIRRRNLGSTSEENIERMRRRRGWMLIYPCAIIACLMIAASPWILLTIFGLAFLAILYGFDVAECGSFSSKINEAL